MNPPWSPVSFTRKALIVSYLPEWALAGPAEVDRLRYVLGSVLPGGVRAR